MRTLNLAILGMGNAGVAFAKLLVQNHTALLSRYGANVRVTAIVTATKGTVVNSGGIDVPRLLSDLEDSGVFSSDTEGFSRKDAFQVLREAEYDVAVELTPLDVMTGKPAVDYIEIALARGNHVISANKGPLAHGARRLKELARANGVRYFHETAVMDGTPVFNLVDETLPLCKVLEIRGILNTTTNFVLGEMAKGNSYASAMEEGRRRGFVEADPSLDIDGWDAAAKLAALMNVLMGADVRPGDIDRTGIAAVTADDIAAAKKAGEVIKLVCRGSIVEGKAAGKVAPERLPLDHPYASITGTSSVVTIVTDLMGAVSVTEHDPEIGQTGYGILSDLVRLIRVI